MRHTIQYLSATLAKTTRTLSLSIAMAGLVALPLNLSAHCQVPCGIYDDNARVVAMAEDAATVIKAVTMINQLAGKQDAQSQQQLVRWVHNKEVHAHKIITTMADYFLTQRVKSSQQDYADRLIKHHTVILAAMKAKQQSGAETAQNLLAAVNVLLTYYPHDHHH